MITRMLSSEYVNISKSPLLKENVYTALISAIVLNDKLCSFPPAALILPKITRDSPFASGYISNPLLVNLFKRDEFFFHKHTGWGAGIQRAKT